MTQQPPHQAILRSWLAEPPPADVKTALERIRNTEDVHYVAVMPDVHLAQDVCVGTVVATRNLIFPQAVGSDIGCGMAALAFDADAGLLAGERMAGRLMAELYRAVLTMRQPREQMVERLPEPLEEMPLSHDRLEKLKRRDGKAQLGTLGRGNHFLEFQSDEQGRLWIMVHTGSRAIGQAISQYHLPKTRTTSTGLGYLEASSEDGQAYLSDVQWAIRYADLNRQKIVTAVTGIMRRLFASEPIESSHLQCNHNHVRLERHFGELLWAHRKGAILAADEEPGIIPGSMGTCSFHVLGRGCPESLNSSSHGAGRALSRDHARRRISVRALERQMAGVWFDRRMSAGLREEAPAAYKDIEAVMRAQKNLTRVRRRLRPILCHKGY